jgi:uncharacterized protein (DUF362 family)
MSTHIYSRRDFVKTSLAGSLAMVVGLYPFSNPAVVSVVKIKDGDISFAVEKAIDLLGGVSEVLKNKSRILLKPNLVGPDPAYTTKPEVIKALAQLMKKAGKEVCIGEGSAAAPGFNLKDEVQYRTKKSEILDPMQKYIFDQLGYTELAKSLNVPLINLHSGDLMEVEVPHGLMFDKITVHRSVAETDLLCSVPMMKTHVLATVTLGMKNLIGVYPGSVYYSVRSFLHDNAAQKGSPGIAYEIVDMVRASKMGLTVIDASTAMEGDGPSGGQLVKMDLIIAGINPLATDMVAADIMGFGIEEVPTFKWAIKSGMKPGSMAEIEIRGEKPDLVRKKFVKPNILSWNTINQVWGNQEL